MRTSKKGQQAGNAIFYVLYVLLTGLVITALYFFLSVPLNAYADTRDFEVHQLNLRIINSLSYVDPASGAKLAKTIRIDDLSEKNIKAILPVAVQEDIGFRIVLDYDGKQEDVYYNRDFYDDYRIFRSISTIATIMVIDDEGQHQGTIEVRQALKPKGLTAGGED